MPDPPLRQIFLPNYKINIRVPADYSDDQVADAIQRNKAQIQQASPVFAQAQNILNQGLAEQGITEQQARQQGVPNAAANPVIAANQSREAQNLALQGRIASLSNVRGLMQRGQ